MTVDKNEIKNVSFLSLLTVTLLSQGHRSESQLSWCEGGSKPGQDTSSVQRRVIHTHIHTHIYGHFSASSQCACLWTWEEARVPVENTEHRDLGPRNPLSHSVNISDTGIFYLFSVA